MLDFLRDNWAAITATIGAIIVWLNERHKRKIEGRVGLNDATEGMQNMYDKFVGDANAQYDKLNNKIKELQQNETASEQVRNELSRQLEVITNQLNLDKLRMIELEEKLASYERTIKAYEQKISDYEAQVKKLKEELRKHKQ